ncbi:MAG TPA: aldo/keto reductase [Thermoanaerobaculia bacterium]|nr:aldo/keto reductase [Thermoanaerobaculia bacterium]
MRTRRLGTNGPEVSALGLGCMALSGTYGPADDAEGVATVHAALDAGITMLDTGDFYGMGHNELLLRQALAGGRRERVFLAVKFGAQRAPDGAWIGFDGRPAAVKNFLSYSLRRLGTDHVDLYQPARVDPVVPIEDTVGAVADLVRAGYVRHLGLSEASAATIRRAHAVHPVAALQIEYSPLSRRVEADILPTLRELGIALVAYGVLSRGLLGLPGNLGHLGHPGHGAAAGPLSAGDVRSHFPRFQGRNLERNLQLVEALRQVATAKGATVPQLAFAWVLGRGDDVVPLAGARTRSQLADLLGALDLELSPADVAALERAVPPGAAAGDRYPAAGMASLDSERGCPVGTYPRRARCVAILGTGRPPGPAGTSF